MSVSTQTKERREHFSLAKQLNEILDCFSHLEVGIDEMFYCVECFVYGVVQGEELNRTLRLEE